MSFNDGAQLDTSQVESGGRGGGAALPIGGGVGLLLLIVGMVFGVNPSTVLSGPQAGTIQPGETSQQIKEKCRTGRDANTDVDCRVVGAMNSAQTYWAQALPAAGTAYRAAPLVLYSGQTSSGCGPASNAVGPFYCPADERVYIDSSFFAELTNRFGADDGALAQEYVVAHEYGHHVQNLLGVLDEARRDPRGPQSGAVRVELMADCLAGVWAHHAARTRSANGTTFLKPLTEQDIESALSAASAVGDDRIQEQVGGRVNPESWTHGSSQQRQRWFTTGYQSGDLTRCDTFQAGDL
ncbi:MAG: KPN_02809 family neutral zinc metallopeptidase [Angustibacter sp.]